MHTADKVFEEFNKLPDEDTGGDGVAKMLKPYEHLVYCVRIIRTKEKVEIFFHDKSCIVFEWDDEGIYTTVGIYEGDPKAVIGDTILQRKPSLH